MEHVSGLMRVDGLIQGQIDGVVTGEFHGYVRGDTNLLVRMGRIEKQTENGAMPAEPAQGREALAMPARGKEDGINVQNS